MKRFLALILVLSMMLALCGCGASKKNITSLDSTLTKKDVLNLIGTKPEEEGENNRYNWSRFAKGTSFFGITTGAEFSSSDLEVAFSEEGTLLGFTFDSLYERSNKDAIDRMIDDFSAKYGNPKKETGYSKWQNDSYEWYMWTDSNIDASIIIYEDSKRVSVNVKYAAFEW